MALVQVVKLLSMAVTKLHYFLRQWQSQFWFGLFALVKVYLHCLTFSNKKPYMSGTHVSKQDILSCTLHYHCISYMENPLLERQHLYQISYHSSIKLHYTFIKQTIKQEHICCRKLPFFTFTLNFGDTLSFYLSKVFLKNIKSTCMTQLLLNCFLSWILENVYCLFFLSSM